ncbi:MAG: hypothetical protein E7163_02605 [Firmicutes bacterium]|nr:hypothetical protein [Bacillota bacterium]
MFNSKKLKPMLLKEVDKPFNDKNYIYELKFDGIRAIIYVDKNSLKITNRYGVDITRLYPELQNIKKNIGNNKVIFDGEIITFDNGVPSFSKLQLRSHLKDINKINNLSKEIPVVFIAFDILYLNKELINMKLIDRKKYLKKFKDTEYFIKTKEYVDGKKLFSQVKKLKLEGIVAKEKNSLYIPGKRVYCWLKIKNFKVGNFIIHGYIKNKNKYSLLLGEYKNNMLYYVGKVSVTSKNETLKKALNSRKIDNKFINSNEKGLYVEPIHKIKVHYMERTSTNMLRQPFVKNKNKA